MPICWRSRHNRGLGLAGVNIVMKTYSYIIRTEEVSFHSLGSAPKYPRNGHVLMNHAYTGYTSADLGSHHPMRCRILA